MAITGLSGDDFNVTEILHEDDGDLSLYSGMDETDINDDAFDMNKLNSKEKEALGLIQTKLGISIDKLQTYDMDTVAGLMAIARAMDAVEKGTASEDTELDAQKDLLKYADNFLGKLYGTDPTITPVIDIYKTWIDENKDKFDAGDESELTDGLELDGVFSSDNVSNDNTDGGDGGIAFGNGGYEPQPTALRTGGDGDPVIPTGRTNDGDFDPASFDGILKNAISDSGNSNLISDDTSFETKKGFTKGNDSITLSTDPNAGTKQGDGGQTRDPRSEIFEANKWNIGNGRNAMSVTYDNMNIPDKGFTNIMQMMGKDGTSPIIQIAIQHGRLVALMRDPIANGTDQAEKIDLGAYVQGQPLEVSLVEEGGKVNVVINGEVQHTADISAWEQEGAAQFRAGVYGQPGASVDITDIEIEH